MARNDPYLPDYVTLSGGSAYFDGSASSTNTAIINEVTGKTDAKLFIEESNDGGTSWTEVTTLTDGNGNVTFSSDFHTQINRIYVSVGKRRLRIDDAGSGGVVSVTGDER